MAGTDPYAEIDAEKTTSELYRVAGVTHKFSLNENLLFNWKGDLLEPTDNIGILFSKLKQISLTNFPL